MTVTDPQSTGNGAQPLAFESAVVSDDVPGGVAYVPASTPLTRLNYYDGRFLRADDLNLEQRAQRALVELSNQAGGPGLVNGFDVSLSNGLIGLSGGLAIDPRGRILYLPDGVQVDATALIEASQQVFTTSEPAATPGSSSFAMCEIATSTATPVPTVAGSQLYLVAIAHAEGLCGNAEVLGRLCDDACITASDRPYRLDGIVLLVIPLHLTTALPTSVAVTLTGLHLRSRIASAYFADEWAAGGSLLSAAGLASHVWCSGAPALLGEIVPVGVLSWTGPASSFVDEWTARRERMEPPPRHYWAGRMEMRPWPTFLAQVLQFQCQFAGVVATPPTGGEGPDPCADARLLLGESNDLLAKVKDLLGGGDGADEGFEVLAEAGDDTAWSTIEAGGLLKQFEYLADRIGQVLAAPTPGPARFLIDWGIVELPAAGYLPVDRGSTFSVRDQMQRFMGGGVDLRVCAVRRDQIAHELERAQHMQRISLLSGLEPAAPLEEVDILVPDGEVTSTTTDSGRGFAVDMALGLSAFDDDDDTDVEFIETGAVSTAGGMRSHALEDKRRVPLEGAGRLSMVGGRLEVCLGASGPVGKGGAALLRAMSGLSADPEPTMRSARRLDVGTDEPDAAEAMRMEHEVMEAVMARRSGESRGRVASLSAAPESPLLALWATASLDTDPFTAGSGTRIGITTTLRFVVPDDATMSLSFDFFGHVTPRPSMRSGGTEMVPLDVDIYLTSEAVNVSRVTERDQHLQFSVTLARNAAGELFLATEEHHDGQWTALGGWQNTPIDAWAIGGVTLPESDDGSFAVRPSLSAGFPHPKLPLLVATATEDPTIAQLGNPYHQAAERAVVLVEAGPPTSESRLAKLQRLFPPLEELVTEVRPTTDWVLFRRRRREDCGDRPPTEAPPARVAAWVTHATGPEAEGKAGELAEALAAGQADDLVWQPLGSVEFAAGSSSPSQPSAWRGAYAGRGGTHVRFVGYAPNGSGDTLGLDRSLALVGALTADGVVADPVTPLAEEVVPPTALEAGTVGSAYFVTWTEHEEPIETTCVDVYTIKSIDQMRDGLVMEIVLSADPGGFDTLSEHGVFPIGEITFEGTNPTDGLGAVADALQTVWPSFPEDPPMFAIAWIDEGRTPDMDEAEEQYQFLGAKFAVELEVAEPLPTGFEDGCRMKLFLLPRM